MTKRTFDEIKEKYPFFIYDYNEWFALPKSRGQAWTTWLESLPEGWEELACKFADKVKEIEKKYDRIGVFEIEQMKEKFGRIRIYWNRHDERIPEEMMKEIDSAVVEAEIDSDATCAICGKPSCYESTGWILPWCRTCAIEAITEDYPEIEIDSDEFEKHFRPTK